MRIFLGVESRLAALTVDTADLSKVSALANRPDLPSTFQPQQIAQLATSLPVAFNTLNVRRAIIPAANGHVSARALARYYAALADGGKIPPPHSSASKPVRCNLNPTFNDTFFFFLLTVKCNLNPTIKSFSTFGR